MNGAPKLDEGEEIVFDHIPNLRSFMRTALVMLGLTLPVVVVFLLVFPDTYWPAVPLFVACVLLVQERLSLGRHRAWITNKRILMQGGASLPMTDVAAATHKGNSVRVTYASGRTAIKLAYPENPAALIAALTPKTETP
ncbi:MAG: hypothetical protein ACSHWY_04505 [Octadecabacter sp.]